MRNNKIVKIIASFIGRTILISFCIIMFFAFIGCIYGFYHSISTKDKGVEVEAVIADVSSRTYYTRHGLTTEYTAYVEYSYEGKDYREMYKYYNHTQKKGDKITITINREKPKDILNFKEDLTISIGGIIIFIFIGIFIIRSEINKRKLIKLGIDVKDRAAVEAYVREQREKKRTKRKNKVNY